MSAVMMQRKNFCEAYDVPLSTLKDWTDKERGFAGKVAYKVGAHWYINIKEFEKWLARKHRESYRYA